MMFAQLRMRLPTSDWNFSSLTISEDVNIQDSQP